LHNGWIIIVLHTHLPYVRHPEYEEFLEEDWLYEAITETYIPLLSVYRDLVNEGTDFHVTMSMSPTLCEMLADPLLQSRYLARLDKLIELAAKEVRRTVGMPYHDAARMYLEHFQAARRVFVEDNGCNLLNSFREFQDRGNIEIITCPATHGFLPLMEREESVRAQIKIAAANYRKHFRRSPRGIWLSECAYRPGVEKYLHEEGIRFFFMDAHGLLYAEPRPKYGVFRPAMSTGGAVIFARDLESSKQVWSNKEGYPGDWNYREFYRDLGYDAHYDHISPYLHKDGVRRNIGIKYHRITGQVSLDRKEPYYPAAAAEKAKEHGSNFVFNRQAQVSYLRGILGCKPVIVSPYDTELFGHWWFEGPMFLKQVFRSFAHDQDELKTILPTKFLDAEKRMQVLSPVMTSWGDKGYNEVWLNGSNDWIYRHLHVAESRMVELANRFPEADGLVGRALNQAARELLLAQASDWAFIMTTGTAVAYAEKRTRDHLSRFHGLYLQLTEDRLEAEWLSELEWRDNIFQELDYRVYRT